MVDKIRTLKGSAVFISPHAPATNNGPGYNAGAFKSGGTAYAQVSPLRNLNIDMGGMASTSEEDYIDEVDLNILKVGTQDYGSVELVLGGDADNAGQKLITTAAASDSVYTVKIMLTRANTDALPGGHNANDKAIYLRGYITRDRLSGGGPSDRFNKNAVVRLVQAPVVVS